MNMCVYIFFLSTFLVILVFQFKVTVNYQTNSLIDIVSEDTVTLGDEFYNSNGRLLNQTDDIYDFLSSNQRMLQNDPNITIQSTFDIKFNDITQIKMLNEWINSVLFPKIYRDEYNSYFRQNYLIGEPMLHFLIRIQKNNENDDINTQRVLPSFVNHQTYGLFKHLGSHAYKGIDDIVLSNNQTVHYRSEKSGKTITGLGGYYLDYPRNATQANNIHLLSEENLIQPTWVNILYSYYFVNPNTGLTGVSMLYIVRTPSGELKKFSESKLTRDFYSSSQDKFRAFLEVVFIMLTCFFAYKLMKHIFFKYVEIIRPRYECQTESIKKNKCCRIINFDITLLSNKDS